MLRKDGVLRILMGAGYWGRGQWIPRNQPHQTAFRFHHPEKKTVKDGHFWRVEKLVLFFMTVLILIGQIMVSKKKKRQNHAK